MGRSSQRTCVARPRPLLVLLVHPPGHEILDIPLIIPLIILFDGGSSGEIMRGTDFELVIVRQMAFAGDMGEKVRDVAESGLLGADIAVQR